MRGCLYLLRRPVHICAQVFARVLIHRPPTHDSDLSQNISKIRFLYQKITNNYLHPLRISQSVPMPANPRLTKQVNRSIRKIEKNNAYTHPMLNLISTTKHQYHIFEADRYFLVPTQQGGILVSTHRSLSNSLSYRILALLDVDSDSNGGDGTEKLKAKQYSGLSVTEIMELRVSLRRLLQVPGNETLLQWLTQVSRGVIIYRGPVY